MELRNKRIVITGGAGFIGSHLIDKLLTAENDIVVIDNFSIGKWENIAHHSMNPHLSVEQADVRDLDTMVRLTRNADVVFHLACTCLRASLRDPITSHEVNATGTLNMCQASIENDVERFVYTSSAEVYGRALYLPLDEAHPLNPTHAYGASKAAAELYVQAYWRCYGLPATILRFFNVYGPRACCEGQRAEVIPKFILRTMAGLRPVIFGNGKQSRSFIWIGDLIRGLLLAAESDELVGDLVQLGGEQEVRIDVLSQLVLEKLGRLDLEPIYLSDGRPGDIDRSKADITKARRILNFVPLVDIDSGLDQYIEWLQMHEPDLANWVLQERVQNW